MTRSKERHSTAPTRAAAHASPDLEQVVRRKIDALSYLPTTTAVAMKFIELGKDPDADPGAYAKVVASDASLSSKLLSLANSSFFGVRNKVTKPQVAVNLLGLGTVRTMAISYCLTGLHNDLRLSAIESRELWQASLCKAVAARQFVLLGDPARAEEAFAAALFQDFAMSVLFACAKEPMTQLLDDAQLEAPQRLQRERELFKLDHAEVGRAIAQKLELPDLFIDAIAFHHNRQKLHEFIGSADVLSEAIYAASLFPHKLNAWNSSDCEALRRLLDERPAAGRAVSLEQFLDEVQKEFEQLYSYFEQGGETEVVLTALMESATREAADRASQLVKSVHQLMHQNASAGREVMELQRRSSQLEKEATHDRLTGALNRAGFMGGLTELIAKAQRYGFGYAVAYFDVDRFKILNDQGGHRCGDAALQLLTVAMNDVARPGDLVGRIGGDEFVLALSDCAERDALDLVQTVLDRVAGQTVGKSTVDGAPLRTTLSSGLLWVPPNISSSLDAVVAQADVLMYQAKRAGGNRVQRGVFGSTSAAA